MSKRFFPLISVIIAIKNEEKQISNCLESISLQSYPAWRVEVILVDNYSSDRTKKLARKYHPRIFDFGPERSSQRNYGAQKAKGEYLLFLDADMILSATVLEKAVLMIDQKNLAALYIPELILGQGFYHKARRFERSFYDGTVVDGLRFFKKDIFTKVSGYDPKMYACEDWDLDRRVLKIGRASVLNGYHFETVNKELNRVSSSGKRLVEKLSSLLGQGLIYHNETGKTMSGQISKKLYYAKNFDRYFEKWGWDETTRKQFSFYYRFFGVFTEKGKWKRLARHPILCFGVLTNRFLVGLVFLFYWFRKKRSYLNDGKE